MSNVSLIDEHLGGRASTSHASTDESDTGRYLAKPTPRRSKNVKMPSPRRVGTRSRILVTVGLAISTLFVAASQASVLELYTYRFKLSNTHFHATGGASGDVDATVSANIGPSLLAITSIGLTPFLFTTQVTGTLKFTPTNHTHNEDQLCHWGKAWIDDLLGYYAVGGQQSQPYSTFHLSCLLEHRLSYPGSISGGGVVVPPGVLKINHHTAASLNFLSISSNSLIGSLVNSLFASPVEQNLYEEHVFRCPDHPRTEWDAAERECKCKNPNFELIGGRCRRDTTPGTGTGNTGGGQTSLPCNPTDPSCFCVDPAHVLSWGRSECLSCALVPGQLYPFVDEQGQTTYIPTDILHCIRRFGEPGFPVQPRKSCNRGDGWEACLDGSSPLDPPPQEDHNWLFPPCHISPSGQQVTTCNGVSGDRPDLVSAGGLSISPHTVVGDPVEVAFTVLNNSAIAAANSRYRVVFHSPGGGRAETAGWIGSLTGGAYRNFVVSSAEAGHVAQSGSYQVEMIVDDWGEVDELREDNNSRGISLHVGQGNPSGMDLRVTPPSPNAIHPVVGDTVTFTYSVGNLGDQPTPTSDLRVYVQGESISSHVETLPPLSPGQSLQRSVEVTGTRATGYTVAITVDPDDLLSEANESNNSALRALPFHAATTCLPCTSGEPHNLVGSELCFDPVSPGLPSHEGTRWTCRGVRGDGTTCVASGNHPNGWELAGPRCPDPATLCAGPLHADLCGHPGLCPGTQSCS